MILRHLFLAAALLAPNCATGEVFDKKREQVENICDLLFKGYSTDEIMTLCSDGQEIKELITNIQTLLHQWHSKEEVITIIVNNVVHNNESDNFLLKLQNIILLGITLGVGYWLYFYYSNFWGTPGKNKKPDSKPLLDDECPPITNENISPKLVMPMQKIEKEEEQKEEREEEKEKIKSLNNLNFESLNNKIDALINHARDIGLKPSMIKFDAPKNPDPNESIENIKISEAIDRQIKYAKSIGLVPHP